jgi:enamine deaminase RidA (YjgF/YER057c/UK114 family)
MSIGKVFACLILIASGSPGQVSSIAAETARLIFRAAPLRGGTLQQQVAGALKDIKSLGRVVKVRAFVTPSADATVVDAAIRRAFPAKEAPVVGLVQIAKLPDPGELVLLEGVTESKQMENPNGLVFISGQLTQEPAGATVASLVARPAANLKSIAAGLNLEGSDFLRVTCFASSVEDAVQVQALVSGTFPFASVSVMQIQKAPANSFVECDAVVRARGKAPEGVRLVNPNSVAFAQAAVVTAPRVIFTSTFGSSSSDDAGVRAAFAKLKGALEAGGSTMDRVLYAYAYPGDQAMLDRYRALRFEYFVRTTAPASTNLVFEGAAATKLGVDAIAMPK